MALSWIEEFPRQACLEKLRTGVVRGMASGVDLPCYRIRACPSSWSCGPRTWLSTLNSNLTCDDATGRGSRHTWRPQVAGMRWSEYDWPTMKHPSTSREATSASQPAAPMALILVIAGLAEDWPFENGPCLIIGPMADCIVEIGRAQRGQGWFCWWKLGGLCDTLRVTKQVEFQPRY